MGFDFRSLKTHVHPLSIIALVLVIVLVGNFVFYLVRFYTQDHKVEPVISAMGLIDLRRDNIVLNTPAGTHIPNRFEVVFDQSKEQVYSPFDVSFTGMSEVAVDIIRQGGAVSVNSQPLDQLLPRMSGAGQVLVLGVSMFRHYLPAELDAIDAFMRRGGGVLVLVEHDNLMENAAFQNGLIERHGIKATYHSNTTTRASLSEHWTWVKSEDWELDEIQFFLPAPLTSTHPNAQKIATILEPGDPNLDVVGYRVFDDRARLIVLGDAEMVWNGDTFMGLPVGDNREFITRIMTLLAGVDYQTDITHPSSVIAKHVHESKKRALFVRDGYSLIPGNSSIGLNNLMHRLDINGYISDIAFLHEVNVGMYDVIFLLNPSYKIADEQIRNLLAARRIILAVDGQADFFGTEKLASEMMKMILGEEKTIQTFIPANELSMSQKLTFHPSVLASENSDNHLNVVANTVDGHSVMLHRASSIDITGNPEAKVLVESEKRSWRMQSLTPIQDMNNPTPVFATPYLLEGGYPVMVQSGNIVAISDVDLVLDPLMGAPEGEAVFNLMLME